MKYIVRLNPRAFNPLTRQFIESRLWEVVQCGFRGSEEYTWHCADVRIGGVPIRELFVLPKKGEVPWSMECSGVCVRGQDNVVDILTGPPDASGN